MGVTNTFTFFATLPPEQRVVFVEAALREPYPELQSAAFEALTGPGGLDRPDIVVQHYAELIPAVRLKVAERAAFFREAARGELRSSSEWARCAAYEVLAAISPRDALAILLRGLSDPSPVVRGNVADTLEAIGHRYYYHLVANRMHDDPESRKFLEEHRTLMMESLGGLLRSFAIHAKRVFLDIAIESGEASYPLLSELLAARLDPAMYATLVHALSTSMSEPAVDLVFQMSLDARPRLQEVAIDVLKLRRDPGFPSLVATVLAKMPSDRFAAVAQRTRDIAWWHTVDAAPEIDPITAAKIMEFIARSGLDPQRKSSLIFHFRGSPYPDVRARVLATLQSLSDPGLLQVAQAFLLDAADEVKVAAARTIIALNPPNKARLLMPLLNASSPELQSVAMREIASASFDKYLRSFDRLDPATQEMAAKALAKIDARIVDRLADEIQSLDPDRRLKALRVIDYVDAETDLRQNLMSLINDPDRRVRATAIKIVQLTESSDGMRLLVAALSDPDRRVRANAIEAFEDSGDARCAPVLLPYLKDDDNRVRGNAAKALWNLGRSEGKAALEAMLRDESEAMRLTALWALGETKIPGAVDVLMARAEQESSPAVRAKILEVLSRLTAAREGMIP